MAPSGDEGWGEITTWTCLKQWSSTEPQGIALVSPMQTLTHPDQVRSAARWLADDGVCVRGDVFGSDGIRRDPDSISITITAVVFQRAPSSPDGLNDPHRKAPKHKEYHYQSLLIKSDCFTKICEHCRVVWVFSAALHLLPDVDGLINSSSSNTGYDL